MSRERDALLLQDQFRIPAVVELVLGRRVARSHKDKTLFLTFPAIKPTCGENLRKSLEYVGTFFFQKTDRHKWYSSSGVPMRWHGGQ